ncbi:MAG TPA: DNA cytosine methyltransferase [Candidatus Melainabacteria bacterium]|nr:DNA cytosine methyltransferase [Candidatus Melainabacteria bacterium]
MIKALELFSGIGAFAEASGKFDIEVVGAYDQDPRANRTYELNHGRKPISRNLDTIASGKLPAADLWWMSPPCQPYSVRGNQKGLSDPRSRSFVNLLGHLKDHRPKVVMVENVAGFRDSDGHRLAEATFSELGYESHILEMSPYDFGIKMRRPRLYLVATAFGITFKAPNFTQAEEKHLREFIRGTYSPDLLVSQKDLDRYGNSLHIINSTSDEAYATCFTSGYWKSFKSSGTFIEVENQGIRRFSPEEIISLMGFSANFTFPSELSTQAKLKLAGNTVDVRAIDYLLRGLDLPV